MFKEADVNWEQKLVAFGTDGASVNKAHTGLITFYSRTFQGLLTIFKESISTSMISHLFNSHSKKAIPKVQIMSYNQRIGLYGIIPSAFQTWNLIFCLRKQDHQVSPLQMAAKHSPE